jgi:muconate cycloisomerase
MRIVGIDAIVVAVPLAAPVTGVHGVTSVQESALARVLTDEGLEGWGNVDPTPGYSLTSADEIRRKIGVVAPALVGRDPFNVNLALSTMEQQLPDSPEARAAVEMALHDLRGRALGLPVHALLGGKLRSEVALNAWIGAVPPAQAAREALAWLERGFGSAKIKLRGAAPEGIDRVAAVRAAVGDRMAVRVDFNESLPAELAAPFIRRLERYEVMLVEQPLPRGQIAGLAELRRGIAIPLMADESVTGPASLIEIIRHGAADFVKVKVMKQGGLIPTLQMVELARAAGMRVVIGHGFGLTLSTLAEAAVAATSENVLGGCEAVGPLKMAGDIVREPARLHAGVIKLPDAPGLGATVDPEAVARYRKA